jgi:tRNA pseudouridine55 synthase
MTPLTEDNVLLFDKPYGWTSFDVVNSVRYTLKKLTGKHRLKVGHAGTLDPLASGLLIICTGKETKNIEKYQALEKEYTGTFYLGATTPTFDLETKPENFKDISFLTPLQIQQVALRFVGEQQQIPPQFSAIKIEGKRAYEYAREKEEVRLDSKTIIIHHFEITRIEFPEIDFRIVCSKGTYIRALARDFGEYLKCGAYLKSLRRMRIGNFDVKNALDIETFKSLLHHQPD